MSWSGLLSLLLLEEIEKDELEIEKWLVERRNANEHSVKIRKRIFTILINRRSTHDNNNF